MLAWKSENSASLVAAFVEADGFVPALFLLVPRMVLDHLKRASYVIQFENRGPKLVTWGSLNRAFPSCFHLDWICKI